MLFAVLLPLMVGCNRGANEIARLQRRVAELERQAKIAEERELDVVLPAASEVQPLTAEPKQVFVNIDKDGRCSVSGEQRTIDELEDIIADALAENANNATVVIRADRDTQLQHAVAVMDVCNKVGVFDYSLTIKALDDEEDGR